MEGRVSCHLAVACSMHAVYVPNKYSGAKWMGVRLVSCCFIPLSGQRRDLLGGGAKTDSFLVSAP